MFFHISGFLWNLKIFTFKKYLKSSTLSELVFVFFFCLSIFESFLYTTYNPEILVDIMSRERVNVLLFHLCHGGDADQRKAVSVQWHFFFNRKEH